MYIRLAQLQLASGATDAAVASTEHGVEHSSSFSPDIPVWSN